jgi:hypothetical protein
MVKIQAEFFFFEKPTTLLINQTECLLAHHLVDYETKHIYLAKDKQNS